MLITSEKRLMKQVVKRKTVMTREQDKRAILRRFPFMGEGLPPCYHMKVHIGMDTSVLDTSPYIDEKDFDLGF